MKKYKFIILFIKKNILTIIFTLFLIFLIVFSKSNIFAAQNGLSLWAKNVIPSLLPFFIATELLNYTNLPSYLGKLTNKFMRPLFNIPGEGSYAFIMGIVSGYPAGAKIVNKFYEEKICTKKEAERMLAFTNNSGPLFIIGTIGISLFGNTTIGIVLFITHILACLTVGIIFGIFSKKNSKQNKNYMCIYNKKYLNDTTNLALHSNYSTKSYNLSNLGAILSTSINNAISTILLIGGFIVLFSIIISIINNLNITVYFGEFLQLLHIPSTFANCILTGLLELTNGVNAVSCLHIKNISYQIVITSFLLGFAGLSILLQIFSIVSKNDLSMKPYFVGKLLQGIFASIYTYLIINNFIFLQLDIISIQ